MDIMEALIVAEQGSAVSRRAWNDPDKIVSRDVRAGDIVRGQAAEFGVFQGPQSFTQDDLEATDWYVVAAIN